LVSLLDGYIHHMSIVPLGMYIVFVLSNGMRFHSVNDSFDVCGQNMNTNVAFTCDAAIL
jgi:hypothetical protein